MFIILLFISKAFFNKIDTLEDVQKYLDFDLFLCASLFIEDFDCFSELNRPCILRMNDLNQKKTELFNRLNLPIYNMEKHRQQNNEQSYLFQHLNLVRQRKSQINIGKELRAFIEKYFLVAFKSEARNYTQYKEFSDENVLLNNIHNEDLRIITTALHNRWQILSKQDKDLRGCISSRVDLHHPYIVPGGRFQEFFYWDTWFILEGLVKTQCREAAFNVVKNVTYMIYKYGFMPNGTRKYFLNRSQPPFYCKMLQSLMNFEDKEIERFVMEQGLNYAIKELEYFEKEKTITFQFNGKSVEMFRYYVETDYFRLESLKDDILTFEKAIEHHKMKQPTYGFQKFIFSCLKSAAESGIDFSNRWFEEKGKIETIECINYVSPDLNALIYFNYLFVAQLLEREQYFDLGYSSEDFRKKAERLQDNINSVLWDKDKKCWFDYNFESGQRKESSFRPSYFFPMFFDIKPPTCSIDEMILEYADEIFGYVGGIPASSAKDQPTSQQWDYPNVWAPYNYLFYQMFDREYRDNTALKYHVAKCFYDSVKTNYFQGDPLKIFYEKYCCTTSGKTGSGGEYPTQDGFGWTNGTTLCFIKDFGDKLEEDFDQKKSEEAIVRYLEARLRGMLFVGTQQTQVIPPGVAQDPRAVIPSKTLGA